MEKRIITAIEAEIEGIVILLNDKPLKQFISACEGSSGWVEVIDINKFRKIHEEEWTEIPTTIISGIVSFKRR